MSMSVFSSRILVSLLGVFLLLPSSASAATGEGRSERFLFAVGANDGGPGRARLRYAGKDAGALGALMQEIGGVSPENVFILEDPDRSAFQSAWRALLGRIGSARASGVRTEVFFYYSGHSNEESLIWGGESLGYAELRSRLRELPAEVVVAILDSCASGAFTRMKGGVLRPAFLQDEARRIQGHAYLTSSSADEVAQESDSIGGSFFTHHLLAGLRGAADTKGSGRVTLTEAYRYAFEETLAQTERSRGGPQHPVYEIDLVGSGELVVTDLGRLSATLDFDPGIVGRVFVRDAAGDLVVEARKRPGVPLRLGLAPGAYVITLVHGENVYEGSVTVEADSSRLVTQDELQLVDAQLASYRKGEVNREEGYRVVPFDFSIFPFLSTDNGPRPTVTRFSLYLFAASGDRLDGSQIGAGVGRMREDVDGVQVAGIGNIAGAEVKGLQVAGLFNSAGGDLDGVQMAGVTNLVQGEVHHLQMAGIFNLAHESVDGLQMSGGPSLSLGDMNGMQMSGTYAHAGGRMDGMQIAGAAALGLGDAEGVQIAGAAALTTGDFSGFQLGGAFAWAGGDLDGYQLAGALNVAGSSSGAQMAAINVARSLDGFQVGAINIAGKSRGTQIGAINIAGSSEAPIGALNLIGDGRFRIGVWGSDLAIPQIQLKTGSQTVHSVLFAGMRPGTVDRPLWTMGAGLGLHLEFRRLGLHFLEPEVVVTNVFDGSITSESHALVSSLRLGLGRDLPFGFSIFAGPSLNVSVQEGKIRDEKVGFIPAVHIPAGEVAVHLWPGFFAGIEI